MKNSTVKKIRGQHGLECLSIQVNIYKHFYYMCNSEMHILYSINTNRFEIIFTKYPYI